MKPIKRRENKAGMLDLLDLENFLRDVNQLLVILTMKNSIGYAEL